MTKQIDRELVACFTQEGYFLDFEYLDKKKALNEDLQEELMQVFIADPYRLLYKLAFMEELEQMADSMGALQRMGQLFLETISCRPEVEFSRDETDFALDMERLSILREELPFLLGQEHLNDTWFLELHQGLLRIFREEIAEYEGTVSQYLSSQNEQVHLAGRVYFHLVENPSDREPFAFLATYAQEKKGRGRGVHTPLKNALEEYRGEREKLLSLLSSVNKAMSQSKLIAGLVDSGELFQPLRLTQEETYTFLKEVELYEECGIQCRIPDWWKKKHRNFKVIVKVGEKEPSKVGYDSLMQFDSSLSLGGESLTQLEVETLLREAEGLRLIKGKWVEVNHGKLESLLDAYRKAQQMSGRDYTLAEAMRLQLDVRDTLQLDEEGIIEVSNGKWLVHALQSLKEPAKGSSPALSADFQATLRPYQKEGLRWLSMMGGFGFGACLADDMGLGKTLQVIALLDALKTQRDLKVLLVLPASIMGNWQKELERFAPHIHYRAVYSKKDLPTAEVLEKTELLLTTYGMMSRLEMLQEEEWDLMILDEAQAIKNPGTKQAKAVKRVRARNRIALTGTPIENNLMELWSLFDFLNAGLLGTAAEFKRFIKHAHKHHGDYRDLRNLVTPFILRRLKSDKEVISDLPEKLEMKAYTTLSRKQVALYNSVLEKIRKSLEDTDGMKRRGLVLSSLSSFKQICNHPDHYLGEGLYKSVHSGKFEMLEEICPTISRKKERVLVFTQYREIIEPLREFLQSIFRAEGLTLHGGTPVKKRSEIVERFQSDRRIPFMVISLKAGGVGLNLTGASHVIHFDRWWNPAVENQATDRAYRIGQENNVMVHKFITRGTVEEKIDEMISDKEALTRDVIHGGDGAWISEMDNEQLMQLFTLQV